MPHTISIDNTVIATITDDQLAVLSYSFSKKQMVNIITNDILNIISHKLTASKGFLQNDWVPLIRQRYNTMPTADVSLANLIYSQPDYQDYDARNP